MILQLAFILEAAALHPGNKAILEAIQQEESSLSNQQTISLAIDKAPNVYRLRIKRMIENEVNSNT